MFRYSVHHLVPVIQINWDGHDPEFLDRVDLLLGPNGGDDGAGIDGGAGYELCEDRATASRRQLEVRHLGVPYGTYM
jgi:hypothetical protein